MNRVRNNLDRGDNVKIKILRLNGTKFFWMYNSKTVVNFGINLIPNKLGFTVLLDFTEWNERGIK